MWLVFPLLVSLFGLFPVLVSCVYELILVQLCLSPYLWLPYVFYSPVCSVWFGLVYSLLPVSLSVSAFTCQALPCLDSLKTDWRSTPPSVAHPNRPLTQARRPPLRPVDPVHQFRPGVTFSGPFIQFPVTTRRAVQKSSQPAAAIFDQPLIFSCSCVFSPKRASYFCPMPWRALGTSLTTPWIYFIFFWGGGGGGVVKLWL